MTQTLTSDGLRQVAGHAVASAIDAAFAEDTEDTFYVSLATRILDFERQHEMTSDQLQAGLKSGAIKENEGLSQWLFWLQVKAYLDQQEQARA